MRADQELLDRDLFSAGFPVGIVPNYNSDFKDIDVDLYLLRKIGYEARRVLLTVSCDRVFSVPVQFVVTLQYFYV